ncbi:type IV secretory system conjugative DNA transfer family protein [Roseiflexus sp.]|uniref:type IV secretory system conjugative DNA transfer family protein n=1 Tax=Roseiflexus sp. TaxID=2562120 RepID=UPI00398A933C
MSRGSLRSTAPNPPPASRPPRPDLPLHIVRGLAFACIALAFAHPLALPLLVASSSQPTLSVSRLINDPAIASLALLHAVFEPSMWSMLVIAAQLALGILLAELSFALAGALLSRHAARHAMRAPLCLQIRPTVHAAEQTGATAKPGALMRLIHGGAAARSWAHSAPRYMLLVSGAPDLPAELEALLIGTPEEQQRAMIALDGAVRSSAPGTLVNTTNDPLLAAMLPGRWVAWQRFGLALPPAYPLRAPSIAVETELAGVVLAAVRPYGSVAHAGLELALRPQGGITGWALGRQWRARATALKLALEQRQDYALAPDIAAIEAKLGDAAFETTIVATAVAERREDALAALRAIGDALGAFQQRIASRLQRLVPRSRIVSLQVSGGNAADIIARLRTPLVAPPPALLLPFRLWRGPDILTAGELGYLWNPSSTLSSELMRCDPCRRIAAPPHAFCGNDPERIVVGYALHTDGHSAPVGPTLRDLRQILHLTAGMGAGKSRLLANLCQQLMPHGFMLIDGKGDDRGGSLVDTVRRLISLVDEERLVLLDPLDTTWPVGLNPLAGVDVAQPGGADLALGQILATFARIDPGTWERSPGMQQFARMATLLVLEGETHPTLAHVKQALLDEAYREELLQSTRNIEVASFWRETYPRLGEGQRSSCDALLRRFDALLTAETTRYLVAQAQPTLDLAQMIASRMIVLVPLPDVALGGLAGAVGMLLAQAFVRAAFSRSGGDQTRHDYPLIIDELQVLIGNSDTSDIATAITRLRSLGIPTIYAHQALAQLGDLRDLMLINAGNRIMLQTQEPDAGMYARAYAASGLTAADLSGQPPNDHQYAVLRCRGMVAGPFSMQPLPWPQVRDDLPPSYTGPDWRDALPDDGDPADRFIARVVYEAADGASAARELARLDDADWRRLLSRWDYIRLHQRQYILKHPSCIPDRLERQRWLSRLYAARPRVLAAAEYLRGRQKRSHQKALNTS